MKIAVFGNTKQTLKGLRRLVSDGYDVRYVFGLPDELRSKKVNSVSLDDFCAHNEIYLDKTNNWDNLKNQKVDLVIGLGDSRIVPEEVIKAQNVIGNHGAILPSVQGAASLVWGRMLNTGTWGVSIFKLAKRVDAGDILVTKEFEYDRSCSMDDFVDAADDITIDALFEYLDGNYSVSPNARWNVRLSKHTDNNFVVENLRSCLQRGMRIYLPPRNLEDAKIVPEWESDFVETFKLANDHPYPKWREK